jgi:hypothetical protein
MNELEIFYYVLFPLCGIVILFTWWYVKTHPEEKEIDIDDWSYESFWENYDTMEQSDLKKVDGA